MGVPFDEKELEVVGKQPQPYGKPTIDQFKYPVTEKEATKRFFAHKPVWTWLETEKMFFNPRIIPDNVARGFVADALSWDSDSQAGGPDMFGIEWEYEKEVGGSMEVPDQELFEDAEDWRSTVVFPDVDSWDWEGAAKANEELLQTDKFVQMWLFTGWFERLISFMGFENAAIALIDEDQQEEIIELLDKVTDVYIDIVEHCHKYFHPDGFYIHDDWGSSNNPFFSFDAGRDVIVPAMRKLTDRIHELGMYAELHSCGKNERQIENFIAAGWDAWCPQDNLNDCVKLWDEYGDRIAIAVPAFRYDKETATEEEQRAAARKWADAYCTTPGKVAWFLKYDGDLLLPAFRKELYVASRKAYADWPDA